MSDVLTFIMAGGKGERLYPLTRDRAKPAVPFGGIYRIIDFTLSNCINSGLRKIYVLTQYKSLSLIRHLRLGWNVFDMNRGEFIDVIHPQQRVSNFWYRGTADSVYQSLYSVRLEDTKYVIILAGDHVYKMNYHTMLEYHKEKNADVTVGIVNVPKEKINRFGLVKVDESEKIVGFKEKPSKIESQEETFLASMGIYIFNTEVLESELSLDAINEKSSHDFGKDVLPSLINRRKVLAYRFKDENKPNTGDYWKDVGTIDDYYEANLDLASLEPKLNLYDNEWPIRTYREQVPSAKFVHAGYAEDAERKGYALMSLVGGGCIISGGKVVNSLLSYNVRVNSYSEVHDSIIMEGAEIGRHAKVRRAIVDKDVHIAPGTEIGYDVEADKKRFFVSDSGIVVVAKGTSV
jgi:glucose-1-phosphate adenylyltransferase